MVHVAFKLFSIEACKEIGLEQQKEIKHLYPCQSPECGAYL
jgi:hypothetical protein